MAFYRLPMGHTEWRIDRRNPAVQRPQRDAEHWLAWPEAARVRRLAARGAR